jgi:hypothetical protein
MYTGTYTYLLFISNFTPSSYNIKLHKNLKILYFHAEEYKIVNEYKEQVQGGSNMTGTDCV